MDRLLWFHTFRRTTLDEVLNVLRGGPIPTPPGLSSTTENQDELGLPPCVYVYLGVPSDAFGDCCFALPLLLFSGTASPFDTGGLIDHIAPANLLQPEERRELVSDYSWPTTEIHKLLEAYPTKARLPNYLRGARPPESGPHEIWTGTQIDIWSDGTNDWHAWTWEGRTPGTCPTGTSVVKWSCSPPVFQALQNRADEERDPSIVGWFADLFARYTPGGVSALIAQAAAEQGSP